MPTMGRAGWVALVGTTLWSSVAHAMEPCPAGTNSGPTLLGFLGASVCWIAGVVAMSGFARWAGAAPPRIPKLVAGVVVLLGCGLLGLAWFVREMLRCSPV